MLGALFARLRQRPVTVAVVGALRSGTNYLRFLLERNYSCNVVYDAFGWKHAGLPILSAASPLSYPDLPILFVVKGPHAFCRSLHRYHLAHGRNLLAPTEWPRFLREPLVLFDRDAARSPQFRFANPVQYWCFVYWNLAFLPEERFRVHGLRYEDLLADPEGTLEPVARALGLRRHGPGFETPDREMRRMKDRPASARNPWLADGPFDKSRYAPGAVLEGWSAEDLAFVARELDPKLLARLGYELPAVARTDLPA